MIETAIDAAAVRDRFPSLTRQQNSQPVVYFDNPAGTQVPQETIDGFTRYFEGSNANVGGSFLTSRETGDVIEGARQAMADFLGADSPEEIVFGPNMTSLTFDVSHALGRMLREGDEIVTTRLEHDANIAPWLALQDRGIVVKWIDINPDDVTLDLDSAADVISERTRIVALGYASNAFGTVNDVRRVADMAHARGAWVFVDAVHYGPHGPIDVKELGCDLLTCSAYKFFGPHLGTLWGRYEVLETLPAFKVRPAAEQPPGKWETGTMNHEALSGLLGTLSYLESLADHPSLPDRRSRLHDAMTRIRDYERSLSGLLIGGLQSIPGVTLYGITEPSNFDHRVPTASFTVRGRDPRAVQDALSEKGIFSWSGNHYALEPLGRLGLASTNRVGLVHYNTPHEIDRFLQAVEDAAA
ncbi:MAG: cysteine desulfurase-like protein [Chloroflexota bacterium]